MNIIELSQNEKDNAIEDILLKGLSKPKSLWRYLCDIYRALGFRYIFLDMGYAMIMTVAATIGFLILYPLTPKQHIHATLFAVAPVFFIFIVLFTETIEKVSGLYELKMTCKYTVHQITTFRVLCFSLIGAMFCTLTSIYFNRSSIVYDFFRLLSLSLCALFLCAFLTTFVIRRFNWKWNHLSVLVFWIAIALLPAWIIDEQWELFLSQIPVTLSVLGAVIACILFLLETRKLMNIREREVTCYVGC